ncbi:hypothetical protein EZS27_018633 [termite gut metagenome]|uniref:Transposase IS30-like HTH domain-containing protein n=1 Tax=termite gut metagenome TaxID=433724 RepID=A0A5J4RH01_9ZZZZ
MRHFRSKRRFTEIIKRKIIRELTGEQWSPEQIVGKARKEGKPMVSHERIYQFIREDKASGGVLYKNLRHRLKHRKRAVGGKEVVIPDKVSIEQRPEIINQKQRFGDWEIDTIVGKENQGAILTVTERKTGLLLMKKCPKANMPKPSLKNWFSCFCRTKTMSIPSLRTTEPIFTNTNGSLKNYILTTSLPIRILRGKGG